MLLLASFVSSLALAWAAPATQDPGYSCQPGQKCWPSLQEWQQLNQTLDGHLYQTVPMGAPCYENSTSFNAATCDVVENNYNNSIPRGDSYGQTYWQNWEACGTTGCSLLSEDPSKTLYPTCSLGRLASYYVDVRNASHISGALKFAQAHNIRISIKNTGHDFFGRSSVPNSLAIWTHNLNTFDFFSDFTASNCPAANGKNIGEMGAGVVAGDSYRYFNSKGMDVTGGYEESVGIAGGFGQGGGLGDFTTTYGLMVDNAVEFDVVLASGEEKTINQCNDPDLFWAMRGGGGGTFAILTKYRIQLYPSLRIHTWNFKANFTGNQSEALRYVLLSHAENQLEWSKQLVTGGSDYQPEKFSFDIVLPYADDGAKLRAATAKFNHFISNHPNISVVENNYISFANYTGYLAISTVDARATEPAGISSLMATRLIPRDVFATPSGIAALVDGVIHGIEKARALLPLSDTQIVFETPVSNPDSQHATSAHPALRDAIWHVIHVAEWEEPLTPSVQENATEGFLGMLDPLKALSPGGGAYLNEAHWGEPDWQATFWGASYERLLEVKNRYDPTHVFDCWKCVGWRGESDPFYSCYEQW